jgi:hypothetical protein
VRVYFIGQVDLEDADAHDRYMEQATPSVIADRNEPVVSRMVGAGSNHPRR